MINLDILTESLCKRTKESSKAGERVRRKLEKTRERKINEIKESYAILLQKETVVYEKEKEAAHIEYCKDASGAILEEIKKSYDLLQNRSTLVGLTIEQLEKITRTNRLMESINSEDKEKVRALLNVLDLDEQVKQALSLFSQSPIQPADIVSYIAAGKDKCYLLTPANEKSNKLTGDLENKLMDVLAEGIVYISTDGQISNNGVVKRVVPKKVEFSADDEFANGFLFYVLKPQNPSNAQDLVQSLTSKLKKLQPNEFDKVKLRHEVQELRAENSGFEILEYFRTHSIGEITKKDLLRIAEEEGWEYVSIDEASVISNRSKPMIKRFMNSGKLKTNEHGGVSVASLRDYLTNTRSLREKKDKLDYSSLDSEERRQEAQKRLNDLGEEITTKELAYVLGLANRASTINYDSKITSRREKIGSKREKILFQKEAVYKFISEYNPTRAGWKK